MEKNNRSTCTTSYGNITAQSYCLLWKYYRTIGTVSYRNITAQLELPLIGILLPNWNCLLWEYCCPTGTAFLWIITDQSAPPPA